MATKTGEPGPFRGFRPEAIQFLADLAMNNERAWFQPRKGEYERLLRDPLAALCAALAERFAARGLPLRADPLRSPFRIYRDTRFSRDKSPYKTHVSADFPWTEGEAAEWGGHGIGGYFHFQPGEIYGGGGMWHPAQSRLAGWRRLVDGDPTRVRAALDEPGFVAAFGAVSGDRLKRVPPGYAADHPEAELLKLKDVTFGRRLADAEALSPELPDTITTTFVAALPLLRLLASLPAEPPQSG
ncbi:MAG: DUF2461 domain-containing protein [Candidatus Limnocylindrales bacterium]